MCLELICDTIPFIFHRAEKIFTKFSADSGVEAYASKILNSFKLEVEMNMRSLRNTSEAYIKAVMLEWKKLFCFVFRFRNMERKSSSQDEAQWITLTRNQVLCIDSFIDKAKENDFINDEKAIEIAVLGIFMSFIKHKTYKDFDSPILCYAATNAINTRRKTYRDVTEFTPQLSRLIYALQLCIGYNCYLQYQTILNEYSMEDATEQFHRILEEDVKAWLSNSKTSPAMSLLLNRALFMSIAKTSVVGKTGHWNKEGTVITYRTTIISMDMIRLFIKDTVQDLRTILFKDLLFGLSDFPIPCLKDLVDDLGNTDHGYYFASDSRNKELQTSRLWLFRRMNLNPSIRRVLLSSKISTTGTTSFEVDKLKRKEYELKISQFLEKLFIAIHLGSGQPARGTEISGLQVRNDMRKQRSLFIIDAELCFILHYNKSQSIRKSMNTRSEALFPSFSTVY